MYRDRNFPNDREIVLFEMFVALSRGLNQS
jgi:hypothetical protein